MPRVGEWLDLYDAKPKDAEKLPGAVARASVRSKQCASSDGFHVASAQALGVLLETLFADDAEFFFQREWTVADQKFVTNWRSAVSFCLPVPRGSPVTFCTQALGEGAAAHGPRANLGVVALHEYVAGPLHTESH